MDEGILSTYNFSLNKTTSVITYTGIAGAALKVSANLTFSASNQREFEWYIAKGGNTIASNRRQQCPIEQLDRSTAQEIVSAPKLGEKRGNEPPAVPLEPRQQPRYATRRHLRAKVVSGHVFQMMSLVQHETPVRGQHRGVAPVVLGPAYREVGREKVVVDDHHVGVCRPATRLEQKAAVEVGTLESSAQIGLGLDLVPHFR